ncbi:sensor histidine kinase [Pseudolysinimonas sp.]|jgi:signal transduction histidine kinase|uniref:sensor histidine kinase n=1 Tax=Pseudolysinimonas sp. TaxID=2680009 RepID=UPI0037851806
MRDATTGRSALDSVTRSMALALGVGSLAFFLLALPSILSQSAAFGVAWTTAAAAGMFAPLIVGAISSPRLSPPWIRRLAGLTAVAQLLTLATILVALPGGTLPEQYGTPWPLGAVLLGCASAAVAWRAAATWPYVAVVIGFVGVDRFFASERPILDLAIQDALHSLLFTAIFTSLALAIRSAGRQLDEASDRAVSDTRKLATAEARVRERGRIEALVHDSVLVALLASARRPEHASAAAREALTRLDQLEHRADVTEEDAVDAQIWLWRVQASTTQLDPTARFSHEDDHPAPIPADVADAMLEASAEALRNSVIHAGPASRAVHVRLGATRVDVTVIDDGRGFDVDAVDEARLGLAVSIRDRMRSLAGGRAVVVSQPGLGTRVALIWEAS